MTAQPNALMRHSSVSTRAAGFSARLHFPRNSRTIAPQMSAADRISQTAGPRRRRNVAQRQHPHPQRDSIHSAAA